MSAARKKAVVRMLSGEVHRGYLPAGGFGAASEVDLLLPDGRAIPFVLSEVKYVAYVKDFNTQDLLDPERIVPRSFASKPRTAGIWVRLGFVDDDSLEGQLHDGIGLLDSLLEDQGLFLDPPDKRGNTQRLFVPRTALASFETLGVSGKPVQRRHRVPGSSQQRQGDLFDVPGKD